jgi:hypothetical protein
MRDNPKPQPQSVALPRLVQTLLQQHCQTWWESEKSLPTFRRSFTPQDQAVREEKLAVLAEGLVYELRHVPADPEARQGQQERLREQGLLFACDALNLEPRHITFLESSRLLAASQEFARQARAFDPGLRAEDIFQASRNVMTMNFMQLLLGLPVEVTPSVFAYSMLYPYTDNYLDDPQVAAPVKLAFNRRFQLRLEGEDVSPANPHEAVINRLVEMIENQWERARFPLVYESLLAIHTAQVRSLGLVAPGAAPYELDVLGLSFEKGGTSVLADGYLVAGALSPAQAALMFGYGAFTQLMDDLEDVLPDLREGRMTIFSQSARHWPLDGTTNRLFHFGRAIFRDLSAFSSPATGPLKELIERSLDPLLIDSAGRVGQLYSKAYLRQVERSFPFRFASLRRQREKLERQKVTLERLIEAFLLQPVEQQPAG